MQAISFRQVEITDGFWHRWQEINRKITIRAVKERFEETGRFDAFRCNWREGMPNRPHYFWDSDVAKWIEGAAYILEKAADDALEEKVDWVVAQIAANQSHDGYFNIYFTVCDPENRFRNRQEHELYCAGHLIEAAAAYYRATGKDRFLRLMCAYADCIERVFMREDSAAFVTGGHPEIELALVRLYECTEEPRYLALAGFFIDRRGCNTKDTNVCNFLPSFDQHHLPVRQQATAEGHSVRACYLYAAMADLARINKDGALLSACRALFDNITSKRMYITGGIGQSHVGEAFTIDYDLPNAHAYAETCAAISLAFFAQRMLCIEADSRYADVVERVLYNGILSGISLSGDRFFYENPLEINPRLSHKDASIAEEERTRFPITQRVKGFQCSCCPPNMNRFLASVGDYAYTKDGGTYFVHQYMNGSMTDGGAEITQATRYPQDGQITMQIKGVQTLAFRVPSWCESFAVNAAYTMEKGYAYVAQPPAVLTVSFEMKPVLMQASPRVQENAGKAAVQMGPLVYCAEALDNGDGLKSLWLDSALPYRVSYDDYFGANILAVVGFREADADTLYYPLRSQLEATEIRLIPYFTFANRGETEMLVWLNRK